MPKASCLIVALAATLLLALPSARAAKPGGKSLDGLAAGAEFAEDYDSDASGSDAFIQCVDETAECSSRPRDRRLRRRPRARGVGAPLPEAPGGAA